MVIGNTFLGLVLINVLTKIYKYILMDLNNPQIFTKSNQLFIAGDF